MANIDSKVISSVFALRNAGLSYAVIGVCYNRSKNWAIHVIRRGVHLGFFKKEEVRSFEHTTTKVRHSARVKHFAHQAAALESEGKSHREIGEIFGVSTERIGQLLRTGESQGWFASVRYERQREFERQVLALAPDSLSVNHLAQRLHSETSAHRIASILKKHNLLFILDDNNARHSDEVKKQISDRFFKRYRDLVEYLGFDPGTKVIRSYDSMLLGWIFRNYSSIDTFREDIGATNVMYKRAAPSSRKNSRKIYARIDVDISVKEAKILSKGCASVRDLARLLTCSGATARLLLERHGLYEEFHARVGTVAGKTFKGPQPSPQYILASQNLAVQIIDRMEKSMLRKNKAS